MPARRRHWARYSVRLSSTESAALLLGALALLLQLPAARRATAQVVAPAPAPATAPAPVLHLQDDEQQPLDLARPAQRIVSLAPGATAMLFAAGAGERVVGTSQYSTEPAAANAIARIGDAQSFDLERILALHPDVVVVWAGGTSPTQLARLQGVGLRIYRHRLARLDDIPASLLRLGRLAGTEAAAQPAAEQLRQRIAALRARYLKAAAATVLIQVWNRPIYTVGRDEIMTDVIHACGYRSIYEDLADPGPAVTLESVLARDPQIILALPPDESSGRDWVGAWRAFPTMRAVHSGRVLSWTDQRLSRLGPSIVDAAEDLCGALRQPKVPD
jgi:iron complex transport system substrate-binding protein